MRIVSIALVSAVLSGCGVEFAVFSGDGGAAGDGGSAGVMAAGGEASGGEAGAAPGTGGMAAEGGAGGESPITCHPRGLVDDFDGTMVDDAIWNTQGAPIIGVYGGALHFDPEPNQSTGQWAGLVTDVEYDVRDCSVWIEAATLTHDLSEGFTYWQLYHSTGTVVFRVQGNSLLSEVNTTGMPQVATTVPYDPVAHRWWRIRESAGSVHHETSADGMSWSVQQSVSTPDYVANSAVGIGRVSESNSATPGTTVFDRFNVAP